MKPTDKPTITQVRETWPSLATKMPSDIQPGDVFIVGGRTYDAVEVIDSSGIKAVRMVERDPVSREDRIAEENLVGGVILVLLGLALLTWWAMSP